MYGQEESKDLNMTVGLRQGRDTPVGKRRGRTTLIVGKMRARTPPQTTLRGKEELFSAMDKKKGTSLHLGGHKKKKNATPSHGTKNESVLHNSGSRLAPVEREDRVSQRSGKESPL